MLTPTREPDVFASLVDIPDAPNFPAAASFNLDDVLDAREEISRIARSEVASAKAELDEKIAAAVRYNESTARRIVAELNSQLKPKCLQVRINQGPVTALSSEPHAKLAQAIALATVSAKRRNVLLAGPAGSGKTTLAKQAAEALGLRHSHLTLTAGASETWLFGRQTPNGFIQSDFWDFYKNGGLFLLDEVDGADANMLLCLNTLLENGHGYNPIAGEKASRHPDFICFAAANTTLRGGNSQYTGRNRLDAAFCERFFSMNVGYDEILESRLCPDAALFARLKEIRTTLEKARSDERISTRKIAEVSMMMQSGIPESFICENLTFGWSVELVKQCGLQDGKLLPVKPEPASNEKEPF